MKRLLHCGGLVMLLLAFSFVSFAGNAAQKEGDEKKTDVKKEGDEKDTKKKDTKEKFSFGQKLVGKVTQLDTNSVNRDFTLKVTTQFKEINPDAQGHITREQQSYATELQRANATKNAGTRASHLQNAARHQQNIATWTAKLYRTKEVHNDYKYRPAENVIVRLLNPEPEYDDKGNLVEFTKKDLERLKKPNPEFPGYHGELSALRVNQSVAVYTPKAATSVKEAKKKKKVDDDDTVISDRTEVILIIIDNPKIAAPPK